MRHYFMDRTGSYLNEIAQDGQKYRKFLVQVLPVCVNDLTILDRQIIWFQHDGSPDHYSKIAREALNWNYPDRWIGRNGPVAWPVRSNFFSWVPKKIKYPKRVLLPRKSYYKWLSKAISTEKLWWFYEFFIKRTAKFVEVNILNIYLHNLLFSSFSCLLWWTILLN